MFNKTAIDLSKVRNVFTLLTVFLVISESLLGFWLFKAEGPGERITAGVLITAILSGFMLLSYKIRTVLSTPSPEAQGQNITAAVTEVTTEEINVPVSEQIAGPGNTYTIAMPPSNWVVKQIDLAHLAHEILDIPHPEAIPGEQSKQILLLQSKNVYEAIPIPGKTTVNGRMIPTALTTRIHMQLAIVPLERLQPPFYSENPFAHNVYTVIGQMLQGGLINMQKNFSGKIQHTGREFIQADLLQQLEHIDFSINGQLLNDVSGLRYNITIIGIKGDIIDHLLLLFYPSWSENSIHNNLQEEFQILQRLASSFKPLKDVNPAEKLNAIREQGRKRYELVLSSIKNESFLNEMGILLRKISGLNQKSHADQMRIINLMRPFKQLYPQIKMNDVEMDALWQELADAEEGKIQPLLDHINKIIADMDRAELAEDEEEQVANEEEPKAIDKI